MESNVARIVTFDGDREEAFAGEAITLVLTDEEAAAKDGWQLVCVEDYPLGWGKKNKHNLKNKYHSGWRMV